MPTYEFHCDQCDADTEEVMRIAELDANPPQHCGQRMRQVIRTAPMGSVQAECHYVCPKTGEQITSRRQRANNFARHNLMDANDFTPAYLRKKWDARRAENRRIAAGMPTVDGLSADTMNELTRPIAAA